MNSSKNSLDFFHLFSLKVIKSLDFVGNVEAEVNKCLQDMDVDGNGSVSYAEFMVKWKMT